ncbi:iron-sulfur cluster-binding domain-containing protein [Lachnospiraceae bacterium]|nr:iron-sulfur cluster-binding domain-containing protein [Lachnospiraceae bacterium]
MSKKPIKEMIISTMQNGPETLKELEMAKKTGKDISLERGTVQRKVDQYHPSVLRLTVSEIEPVSPIAKRIRLVSDTGYLPPFEAGQYINVFCEIDGARTSRPYSLSSSAKQRAYYEITVAAVEGGFVSGYLLRQLKVGDRLEANGPAGVFRYHPVFHSKRSVFLGGGSGITPFVSMIRTALESGEDRDITLLYGSRTEELAMYHGELAAFAEGHPNFHYTLILSDEEKEGMEHGFIDAERIRAHVPDILDCTYYMCGPAVMMEFCRKALDELQIPGRSIRREVFGTRRDIWNEPGWPEGMTGEELFQIKVGDQTIEAKSGESVLTALERGGLRVNVCCRSGECSLCRVQLVSGKVFTAQGALLRYADELFGYIHSCKAYPISDLELRF